MRWLDQVAVKEYGASFLLDRLSTDLIQGLKNSFPEWKEIFVFACCKDTMYPFV
ncbi:MAG: hypothetical protein M1496_07910 [Candidatus Thermoplasmatota archaeon]|nr:hypothetical protein [Candidatus Thermoplasmatota archaeon]